MEFGKYLEILIIKSGLSMRELGKRAGISHSYLSQVKNGKRGIPAPELLMKIAPHLGVDYMDLMKAAGYVFEDDDFTEGELEFLKEIEKGTSIEDLIKLKPVLDNEEITKSEWEFAVGVIRSLRETKKKGD